MGFNPSEWAVIEDSLSGFQAVKAGGFVVYGFVHDKNKTALKNWEQRYFSKWMNLNTC